MDIDTDWYMNIDTTIIRDIFKYRDRGRKKRALSTVICRSTESLTLFLRLISISL